MSRLTVQDARRVAALSALELSDEDALAMRDQLGAILDHIAALDAVDVSSVEPTFHPFAEQALLRADEAKLSGMREALLDGAPHAVANGFAVPKVLEGD